MSPTSWYSDTNYSVYGTRITIHIALLTYIVCFFSQETHRKFNPYPFPTFEFILQTDFQTGEQTKDRTGAIAFSLDKVSK